MIDILLVPSVVADETALTVPVFLRRIAKHRRQTGSKKSSLP
jgi:hypothetical protein